MSKPSSAQLELSRRLLALEESSETPLAVAAARAYQRLLLHLSPIVGMAGVQALFARSVKLSAVDYPCLSGLVGLALKYDVDPDHAPQASPAEELRAYLQRQEALSIESVEMLFAHFCALLAAFIGDRLTAQVLEDAWRAESVSGSGERNP